MLLFDKICDKVIVGNLSGEELVGNVLPASRFIPQCLLEAWKVQVSFSFINSSAFIQSNTQCPLEACKVKFSSFFMNIVSAFITFH